MAGQALVFLIVRYALAWTPLRMALTPRLTKSRRVRRRAVQFFKSSAEKRTKGRVGVLLYLSLAEHRAEIVADEAIHSKGRARALGRGDGGAGSTGSARAIPRAAWPIAWAGWRKCSPSISPRPAPT
ncbi:MAG: hypothetical protein WDN24_00085 [Sphingomonas sp.]